MKLSTSRILRVPMILAAVLLSAFVFALPAEARDRHDHHHHGKKYKKHRHHHHGTPVRFCGSHRHHHVHYWHGWDHRTYKCYGHK